MLGRLYALLSVAITVALPASPALGQASLPGDVDGNGVVQQDDATLVLSYIAGKIPSLPQPASAEVTQDGQLSVDDALAIAQRLKGQSLIVSATALNGVATATYIGDVVRIEAFERFMPFNVTGGTARVVSTGANYDSGPLPLVSERDGRSWYCLWSTGNLPGGADYQVSVTLMEVGADLSSARTPGDYSVQADAVPMTGILELPVSLAARSFQPRSLDLVVDASCPTPGPALEFRRVFPHDSYRAPYLGPLGRGWTHNFDMHLTEATDGTVTLTGADGFARPFTSNSDGTYTASPGDYGALTRDPDGSFTLQEKGGVIYRFLSSLLLDCIVDPHGNRITAIYNTLEQLTEIRHSCGHSFYLAYDADGRIGQLTDHVGRVTSYQYELGGAHLVSVAAPDGATTSYLYRLGQSPSTDHRLMLIHRPDDTYAFITYYGDGRIASVYGTWEAGRLDFSYGEDGTARIRDANGAETTIGVDAAGRPLTTAEPTGGVMGASYDAAGNLVQTADALGHVTQFAYDAQGNITRLTDPSGGVVEYEHDPRFAKRTSVTDALGNTTVMAYDSAGGLLSIVNADGSREDYSYDPAGNLTAHTDAAGLVTGYRYDGQGLMQSLEDPLGATTQFSYGASGELMGVIDANGHVASLARDSRGRMTRRTYPDGSHEDYEYDAVGKLVAATSRAGEKALLQYDAAGRLEWKRYASGAALHLVSDARGQLVAVARSRADGTTESSMAIEYDPSRRTSRVRTSAGDAGEAYEVAYAYDPAGNRSSLTYPDGYVLSYEYDAVDRLLRIADAGGSTLASYQYDAAGRRASRTLGNGTYSSYRYDRLGRLTQLANLAPGGDVQSQFDYTYSVAGLRTAVTTLEGTLRLGYDAASRLTSAEYPDGRTLAYSFDPVGNRTATSDGATATGYAVNALDQYTQAGGDAFTYDANGDLASRAGPLGAATYAWDEEGRLASVDRGGVHLTYEYDHQGRLLRRVRDGVEMRYVWDSDDLIAVLDAGGQVIARYVHGPATGEVLLVNTPSGASWCQQDGLGSSVGTTDDAGALATTCSYDVYGALRSGDPGPVLERFAGLVWDEDANLYYARARWYDAATGRFISPEPVPYAGVTNLYAYVENRPVSERDASGLWWGGAVADAVSRRVYADIGNALDWVGDTWHLNWCGAHRSGGQVTPEGGVGDPNVKPVNWFDWYCRRHDLQYYRAEHAPGASEAQKRRGVDEANTAVILGVLHEFMARSTPLGNALVTWLDPRAYGPYLGGKSGWVFLQSAGGWTYAGGMCPTFVQGGVPRGQPTPTSGGLVCRIDSPPPGALLRADIPIFGVAGGEGFRHYRVEYGEGPSPEAWRLIAESDTPQSECPLLGDITRMQGTLNLTGNLATWNTGLRNWEHLPWHPAEDATDLVGTYTIRLVVEGKDGRTVEDRVTCQVGRAIAQCLPGTAVSPDGRVAMRFPEQSLTSPFRVFTILPLESGEAVAAAAAERTGLIGPAYRVREPGDRFAKRVTLEFTPTAAEITGRDASHVGIARYNAVSGTWEWLDTAYSASPARYMTLLKELPAPEAVFALVSDPGHGARSHPTRQAPPAPPLTPVAPGVLVRDTFETEVGRWRDGDLFVGATVARDRDATPDGSYCVRVSSRNPNGNMSCTVLDAPFDVREYPALSFDYRIPRGVKTDLYLRAGGRWYRLGFTGDGGDLRNRDVNMADLGRIEGVQADDRWHTATANLRELLARVTRVTRVEAIVMADWRTSGYMKLEFGTNPRGASHYIDNFTLRGEGAKALPESLLVDSFAGGERRNALGGPTGTFSGPGTDLCQAAPAPAGGSGGPGLLLTYDTTRAGTYCGYWTSLMAANVAGMAELVFRVRADGPIPPMAVSLRHCAGTESKLQLAPYLGEPDANGWRQVRIPLSAFVDLPNLSLLDTIYFVFDQPSHSGKGQATISDLRFERRPRFGRIASPATPGYRNLLGGEFRCSEQGAAAVSADRHEDRPSGGGDGRFCYRVSFGGTIGLDYGEQGFSYGLWETTLPAFDASGFRYLVVQMRGAQGGETPNLVLDDGVTRHIARGKVDFPALTKNWQEVRLPLSQFAAGSPMGVDLTHLDALQVVFEWQPMSGTIYVGDIRFE